jgi:hypothetical protein
MLRELPTAHTSLVALALTLLSRWERLATFGLDTVVHALPFQWTASVPDVGPGAPTARVPTAQMSFALIAVTAQRSEPPAMTGLAAIVQPPPFHRNTRVCGSP